MIGAFEFMWGDKIERKFLNFSSKWREKFQQAIRIYRKLLNFKGLQKFLSISIEKFSNLW